MQPDPLAAFSALAMTKSICFSRGNERHRIAHEAYARAADDVADEEDSHHGRRYLANLDRAGLADDRHLDFAGIVELLLDGPGDVVADLEGVAVRSCWWALAITRTRGRPGWRRRARRRESPTRPLPALPAA